MFIIQTQLRIIQQKYIFTQFDYYYRVNYQIFNRES